MPTSPTFRKTTKIHPKSTYARRAVLVMMVSLLWPLLAALPSQAQESFPLSKFNPWTSGDGDYTFSVAWGDVDGDGDLDLAVGNSGSANKIYLNQNGVLQTAADSPWSSGDSDYTESVAWGDVDGDGDLDLAVGNYHSANKIYLNQNGVLQTAADSPWSSGDSDGTSSVAWGDVDGDGDLDLAVGNSGDANKIYLNQNGVLQTAADSPWSSGDSDYTFSVAWGDVDGDGDLDLAVGNSGSANKIYLNQNGVLQTAADSPWSSGYSDYTQSVAWGDVDGDGDLDLAVGNYHSANKIYLNQNGVLQTAVDSPWSSGDGDNTRSVAWGDVDGDGDLDLAVGNSGSANKIYLNQNGVLQTAADSPWSSGDSDGTSSVAWGDVDGDGDLDLAVGNSVDANKIYLNQNGVLQTAATWSLGDVDYTSSVAWGDVDGDGDLDLAVGNYRSANKIYLNQNGVLQTAATWSLGDVDYTSSVAWGDVDGDGDLDLAVGNFDVSGDPSLAWGDGDADGDGDLDLAVGNYYSANKIYLNQNGVLQTAADSPWNSGDSDYTQSVAWGDVDGDGDLDLAVGNSGSANKIYLNQNGVLQTAADSPWSSGDSDETQSVAWGDVDGDGDLDLAVGNGGSGANKIYLNQNGVLQTAAAWSSGDSDDTQSVAWGDVDGDGDLDLAVGNSGSANKIYLNQNGVLQTASNSPWSSG
ncbi:MAG: VCBS repeat-containing protein, partial [Caldilineaceae bacterium]|nr:VCBS repeat-containing protein [Caldilineaceae bacterium]